MALADSPREGCHSPSGHSPYLELQEEQQQDGGEGSRSYAPDPLSRGQRPGVQADSHTGPSLLPRLTSAGGQQSMQTKAVSPERSRVQPSNLLQLWLER